MPVLSLNQLLAQLIFWQTPADLQAIPPDPTSFGGVWWQGGRAAEALLLSADWQAHSPIPLLFAAPAEGLPSGGTDFPPFLCLDYQPTLETTAQLARWLSHEARSMGIPLLGLPAAPNWSRDPERARQMIHCWQHAVPDQQVLLAEEVLGCGDAPRAEELAQALQGGVKALITRDPEGVLACLRLAVEQGWMAREQVQGLGYFWLGLKKRFFPQAPLLADLPGDPLPSLQNLLGDTPLPQPWSKVGSPGAGWRQWRAPEALALAEQLRRQAVEIKPFGQPQRPDFTWIWTTTLPTPTTPALTLPLAHQIPYLISHPWRDPHDIEACSGSRILVQWLGDFVPPPLFGHWLAENSARLGGIVIFGQLRDPEEVVACCQRHGIPYARSLSAAPDVQEQLLGLWLNGKP